MSTENPFRPATVTNQSEIMLSASLRVRPARADQRGRLSLLLERLPIAPLVVDHPSALRREIFAWLAKYAEHDPDYADAELCVLAARDKRLRIWTYDSEFTRVWRKSSGRRVALIGQA